MIVRSANEDSQPDPATGSGLAERPSLRCRVIDGLCLGRADDDDPQLTSFLAEPEAIAGLARWFGRRAVPLRRTGILAALDRDIACIDALLSRQVDAILHAPRFQQLEASWRGVAYLLAGVKTTANVKVKLLDARWSEVCRDMERAADFEQSQIWHKIYETEFGMPGGEPFGIILGHYNVSSPQSAEHPTDDVFCLSALSHIAAAAFCPILVGVDAAMFGLDSFTDLSPITDMAAPFRHAKFDRWKKFQRNEDSRSNDDSRFIGVLLPPVALRAPYEDDPFRNDGFRYQERIGRHQDMLWGGCIFPFGAVVLRAYSTFRWSADIRGVQTDAESGGLVADLPELSFATDRPGLAFKYPTAAYFTDRQENDLCELGFLPLINCQYTPYSAFFGNVSVQRPRSYDSQIATTNARMSAMLQYIICVSRFAHYIKVIVRDWAGAVTSAEECQRRLSQWLQGYCTSTDDVSFELKARYPLREAAVTVRDKLGEPGLYEATINLKPHFQLDHIVSSFKLVTTLPGKTSR